MLPLLALALACSGPDTDTETQEVDWGELLFQRSYADDDHLFIETSSTTVGFALAYDTDGAVSTWITFEPALERSQTDTEPLRVEVSTLAGWGAVAERLVDGASEEMALVFTFPGDGERDILRGYETELGTHVLVGSTFTGIEFEVLEWLPSDEHPDALSVRWALWGTPG